MTIRILLTGKHGQVGSELGRLLPSLGELIAIDRSGLDLADPAAIRRVVRELRPQLIVNAAAYTAVDRAETEKPLAHAVNADAPAVIAEEAAKLRATLVHFSTDYVFDGSKGSPYQESDLPNPINVYGATKLAGENAVRALSPHHFIFRTSWVYAPRGRNFLLTILKLATEKEELRIVSDQIGAPTASRLIASATKDVLAAVIAGATPDSPLRVPGYGTYHITAGGVASWFEFAASILEEARRCALTPRWLRDATGGRPFLAKRVLPILSSDYPTPARRPAYSALSNLKFERTMGSTLPDWKSQLRALFEED